ncbi:MAG: oxidoreductase, short-chain dehydrogenase/reductase family [Microgenomates group bacterium Gr01-1014_93]|nr:MAG: oxidoreductase, short-chain dehydrogenase/reductase family [Microgenomates group bacterium Gr01-1014_93]
MNLKGKVVLLTGAKRIGQIVAEELAKKGANLAITYRSSKEEAEAMCVACVALGVKSLPFQADLSKEDEIKNMVSAIKQEFGRIDILVHMAAPYPKTPLEEVTMEEFNSIQTSISGSALMLAKYIIPLMMENKQGKIIFFSDWSVLERPYTDYSAYNMAKAGINSLTKGLARQVAPNITVNAIAPGPMIKPPDLTEEENEEALSKTPLRKWGGALPIAQAVNFLLENDFVTGGILPVDGGRSVA